MNPRHAVVPLILLSLCCAAEPVDTSHHDPAMIEAILEDVRVGWEQGDGAPFYEHFVDWEGARYFEGGGENVGLRDLVENHVEPEAELGLRLEFSKVQTHFAMTLPRFSPDGERLGLLPAFPGDRRSRRPTRRSRSSAPTSAGWSSGPSPISPSSGARPSASTTSRATRPPKSRASWTSRREPSGLMCTTRAARSAPRSRPAWTNGERQEDSR